MIFLFVTCTHWVVDSRTLTEGESKGVPRRRGHSYFESRDLRVGKYGFDMIPLLWGIRSQLDTIMGRGVSRLRKIPR